jgi:hypothetical protein
MNFHVPEAALAVADEISLGDLFRITEDEKNQAGIIRMISYCRSHLMIKPNKTDAEKNLLLDLIELANEIGTERFDHAFAKDRERLAARKTPQLPIPAKGINPNPRKAEVLGISRARR